MLQTSSESRRTRGEGASSDGGLQPQPGSGVAHPVPRRPSGQRAGRLRPWGWPAPRSRRMPGGDLVVAHRAVARPSAAAVSCPLPRSPRKQAWCRPSLSLLKDVLLPETGPLAGRCLPARAPSQAASLGTTPSLTHAHTPIRPFTLTQSSVPGSALGHIEVTRRTPLWPDLYRGAACGQQGEETPPREPKRKWGQKVSCPRGFVCVAHVLRRGHGHVSPVSRRPGPGRAAGECALASVL